MKYDFTTHFDRSTHGSYKWNKMKELCPDVPKGIVPFSTADMEFLTPPPITDRIARFLREESFGYTGRTERYMDAVSEWMLTRHGYGIIPEWLQLSPGIVTALFMAVRALTEPGDGVIIETPVYPPFYRAIEQNGRTVIDVPLIETGLTYVPDFDALEKAAARPDAKLMILCSPHNPAGRVWTKEELTRRAEICEKYGVFVVSDEIHNDLVFEGHPHTVFATVSDWASENSIVCTAPSKTFNIPGLQCSNLFIRNEAAREKLSAEYERAGLEGLNALAYPACETAYRECASWLTEALSVIRSNADFAERFLKEEIPEIRPFTLEGTYLGWWDCRALGLDREALNELFYRKAYFFSQNGSDFGTAGEGFMRVNLACPKDVLVSALERLKKSVRG